MTFKRCNLLLLCFLSIVYFSCEGYKKSNLNKERASIAVKLDTTRKTINEVSSEELINLKEKVIKEGDTTAYKNLKIALLDYPPEDLIFWSLCMANKYNYFQANLDFYHSIIHAYENQGVRFNAIDNTTKSMLKRRVKIAANSGIKEAKEILSKF